MTERVRGQKSGTPWLQRSRDLPNAKGFKGGAFELVGEMRNLELGRAARARYCLRAPYVDGLL